MRAWMRGMVGAGAATMIVALASFPQPAAADLSLDVTPAQYEFQANAGTQTTFPILVRNVGNGTVHVVVTLADVDTSAANGSARFLPAGTKKFSASRFSAVNPREFDIPENGVQQVRYTVSMPATARGEYTSFVFFTTRPPRKPGGFGLAESVASRLYAVAGDAITGGAVGGVSSLPVTGGREYSVKFLNTGSMHEYVGGIVNILKDGAPVDHITLPAHRLVPRGEALTVTAQGKKLPAGTYDAIAIVDYGGSSRVAGKTTFVVQ
jgi:hypothetical protein